MGDKKPKGAGKSSFELVNPVILNEVLPLEKGSKVLDLACGMGLYSLFLSEVAGDGGVIYSLDLWEEGLKILENEKERRGIGNIKTIHCDAVEKIDLPDSSIDLCLMATVLHDFHEMGKTDVVLSNIKKVLKKEGVLSVIEFKKIDGPPGPPESIRLSEDELQSVLERKGFKQTMTMDIGDYNYISMFKVL